MQPSCRTHTGADTILCDLVELEHLTLAQVMKLGGYKAKSRAAVHKTLQALVRRGLALPLPRQFVTQPIVYTPTSTGYTYAQALGVPGARRVRPVDERKKAKNLLFLHHTVAVTDVLIAAKLLAKTHPLIELSSLYTERSLKRKISVVRPDNQRIYVEPDASCELLISKPWHEPPQTWQDFVHLELYRHRPLEGRFKQKIWGYVTALDTGIHDALFKTSALSIAVMCDTAQQTALLKRWTEETLTAMGRREEGEMFCFRTLHTATASPEEMYLAPVWEQAFGTTKTPLLILE